MALTQSRFAVVFFFNAVLLCSTHARATPPLPTHGPLDFKLELDPSHQQVLDNPNASSPIPKGSPLLVRASFDIPVGTLAHQKFVITLNPMNSEVGLTSRATKSKALTITKTLKQLSGQNPGPSQLVRAFVSFYWKPTGKVGASVDAQIYREDSRYKGKVGFQVDAGNASVAVGINEQGALFKATPYALIDQQVQKMRSDEVFWRSQVRVSRPRKLNLSLFRNRLKLESPEVTLPSIDEQSGGGGQ